jgi:hypothetical protein
MGIGTGLGIGHFMGPPTPEAQALLDQGYTFEQIAAEILGDLQSQDTQRLRETLGLGGTTGGGGGGGGGGGARRSMLREPAQTDEERLAEERKREWDALMLSIREAFMLREFQIANMAALGLEPQEIVDSFNRTIASAVTQMGMLNAEQRLSFSNMQIFNYWLDYLGRNMGFIVGEFEQVMEDYNTAMADLIREAEIQLALGNFTPDLAQTYVDQQLKIIEDTIRALEVLADSSDGLTEQQQEQLAQLYNLYQLIDSGEVGLSGFISGLETAGETIAAIFGTDIQEAEERRMMEVDQIAKDFLKGLTGALDSFVKKIADISGLFGGGSGGAFANTLLNLGGEAFGASLFGKGGFAKGGIFAKGGLLGGLGPDIMSALAVGIAGFALNRIFGGDETIEIDQPVDIRIVDIETNLLNFFNFRGLEGVTYQSNFREVFESGLW